MKVCDMSAYILRTSYMYKYKHVKDQSKIKLNGYNITLQTPATCYSFSTNISIASVSRFAASATPTAPDCHLHNSHVPISLPCGRMFRAGGENDRAQLM